MKKIGILTHYNVNNMGAQLQMYATAMFIKENGEMPIVLTYKKNYDFKSDLEKRNHISIKSVPYIFKEYVFKKGLKLTAFNVKKYKKNAKFRGENFEHCNYAVGDADKIVIGSDECLSLESGVNMMMYGHCCQTNEIVYYAPSFGQTSLEDIKSYNATNLVKSGIESIKWLSARDANTYEMLKKLSQREVVRVCDPVFLYEFKQDIKIKKPKQKYLLVYGYDKNFNDKSEIAAIKKYAKENRLKTVSAGTFHKWCDYNYTCNCLEWLEYFKSADCVITDTFHGTILSLINNKKVVVKIRNSLNGNKLKDLIAFYKADAAVVDEITFDSITNSFLNNIDYNETSKIILQSRAKSAEYLITALGDKNEHK